LRIRFQFSEWAKTHRPKLPEYVKGVVHYEFAVEKDAQKIIEFIKEHIIPSSPLFDSLGLFWFLSFSYSDNLGANPSELLDFYEPIVERTLKDHCSLLGFKGDELVGISLNSIKIVTSDSNEQPLNVEILPCKDYGPRKFYSQ
jgi:hypothetical protein